MLTPEELEFWAHAVQMVESSGGIDVGPRYEPGFERRYGANWLAQGDTAFRKRMLDEHGAEAVYASYGPWQIMYPVAVELGFRGTPAELAEPGVNKRFFSKKFQGDYARTGNIDKTLLRYNGGANPAYPAKVRKHYKGKM